VLVSYWNVKRDRVRQMLDDAVRQANDFLAFRSAHWEREREREEKGEGAPSTLPRQILFYPPLLHRNCMTEKLTNIRDWKRGSSSSSSSNNNNVNQKHIQQLNTTIFVLKTGDGGGGGGKENRNKKEREHNKEPIADKSAG